MIKRFIDYTQNTVGNVSITAQLSSFSPDRLLLHIQGLPVVSSQLKQEYAGLTPAELYAKVSAEKSDSSLNSSDFDSVFNHFAMDLTGGAISRLVVNASLKNEAGKDVPLISNVPLHMFLALSDYIGASDYGSNTGAGVMGEDFSARDLAGTAHSDCLNIAIPLGNVVCSGDDILTVSIGGRYDGMASQVLVDNTAKTCEIDNHPNLHIVGFVEDNIKSGEMLLSYQYVKGLDSQRFAFRNVYDVYSMGDTDAVTYVDDAFGNNPIDNLGCICKGLCDGRLGGLGIYGAVFAPTSFAPMWHDCTGWAQNIGFTTVTGMEYLVVGEEFHPERSGKMDKDVRDFAGFYQSIATDDPEKFAILQTRR